MENFTFAVIGIKNVDILFNLSQKGYIDNLTKIPDDMTIE